MKNLLRMTALLAVLVLCVAVLPLSAHAAETAQYIDNSDLIPALVPDDEVKMIDMPISETVNVPVPEWVNTLILAELRIETATPEGTFQAAERVLDHYAEMGVNGLWITPIYDRNRSADNLIQANGYGNYGPETVWWRLTGKDNYEDSFRLLRAGGFRMAISCMGEGSTLIGRLDVLPVDYLFIDAAYTRRISTNANTYGVASGVLEIARNLHLSVVFLGCDTHAIERSLLKMHVRYAAGELYGESLRETEAVSLLVKDGGGRV